MTSKKILVKKEISQAELKKWYEEELLRKDAQIEQLHKENLVLMKTALKRAENQAELDARSKNL